ncbi:MAG: dihydrofolate reductase [Betaproteobacteria bacterium]
MIISIIAAMAENRVIGRDNKMPWDLPSDRKRFHAITRGHPIILGRKTFESIGRPLSYRMNIVLTRQKDYHAEGAVIVHDLQSAFTACEGADEVFICGGEEIFRETIFLADRIYLTIVHRSVQGDAYFPDIPDHLSVTERREVVEDIMPYSLVLYERIRKRAAVDNR